MNGPFSIHRTIVAWEKNQIFMFGNKYTKHITHKRANDKSNKKWIAVSLVLIGLQVGLKGFSEVKPSTEWKRK